MSTYDSKETEEALHRRLSQMVREYWRERGHVISTIVETVPGKRDRWQVRSDTLNGLPRNLALKGLTR